MRIIWEQNWIQGQIDLTVHFNILLYFSTFLNEDNLRSFWPSVFLILSGHTYHCLRVTGKAMQRNSDGKWCPWYYQHPILKTDDPFNAPAHVFHPFLSEILHFFNLRRIFVIHFSYLYYESYPNVCETHIVWIKFYHESEETG
jgi:hypothetical protein